MNGKNLRRSLLLAAIMGNIVACAPTPLPGEALDQTNPTPPIEMSVEAVANLCDNPYYPVVQGATWTYASTGAPGFSDPYTFTDTITSVRSDGFTLTSQFQELTRTQEWSCRPEGLVALQLGSGPAGSVSTQNMSLELTTANVTGITFPAAIDAGQAWNYALDFTGEMDVAGNMAAAAGTSSSSFTAIGMESVTVPAGTFEAMKVQVNSNMNIQATYSGLDIPVELMGTSYIWLVRDVGWIKMENTGNLQGTDFTETITLQSYDIP